MLIFSLNVFQQMKFFRILFSFEWVIKNNSTCFDSICVLQPKLNFFKGRFFTKQNYMSCMNMQTISGITANVHPLISAVHFLWRALFPPLLMVAFYKISFTRTTIIHKDFFIVQNNTGIGFGVLDLTLLQPFF